MFKFNKWIQKGVSVTKIVTQISHHPMTKYTTIPFYTPSKPLNPV